MQHVGQAKTQFSVIVSSGSHTWNTFNSFKTKHDQIALISKNFVNYYADVVKTKPDFLFCFGCFCGFILSSFQP